AGLVLTVGLDVIMLRGRLGGVVEDNQVCPVDRQRPLDAVEGAGIADVHPSGKVFDDRVHPRGGGKYVKKAGWSEELNRLHVIILDRGLIDGSPFDKDDANPDGAANRFIG